MKRLFLDESGECSFSQDSCYTHFLITIISLDASMTNELRKRLRRKFADFVRNGWSKTREPKAYEIFKHRRFGAEAISSVLSTLMEVSTLEVSYIVVNKDKITHRSFRNAAYGTGYNYFTGLLLSELVLDDGFRNAHLIYDKKNKETHANRPFKEYLETKVVGAALERNIDIELVIEGEESQRSYGLLAVDYFSWAIYRKFEYGDSRFYDLLQDRLKRRREWHAQ